MLIGDFVIAEFSDVVGMFISKPLRDLNDDSKSDSGFTSSGYERGENEHLLVRQHRDPKSKVMSRFERENS